MRCLALAQAWQAQRGEAVFITACTSDRLLRRLFDEGFQVIALERPYPEAGEWALASKVLTAHPGAWVVLDGYHFDPSYQLRIKESGHPLLVIDDMAHFDHYYADMVLNQNINAGQLDYSCEPYARLLLGTRYALLRSEFWPWRGWQGEIPKVAQKVLVTLGGGDPDNLTLKVIHALRQVYVDGLEAAVVVGPSNPHFHELETTFRQSPFTIRLVRDTSDMPKLMAWADLAVSGGGSTCWELAFMGLPNLILVMAENQRAVAEGLNRFGVGLNLGRHAELSEHKFIGILKEIIYDHARRKEMSDKGKRLVDGIGAKLAVRAMDIFDAGDDLQVRPACWDDAELLWLWANDPVVRGNSFHPDPILLDRHIEWYKEKLTSCDTCFWIIEHNRVPVAQIRYDRVNEFEAMISFSVAHENRGRGTASKILSLTFDMACKALRVNRAKGLVLIENKASERAFIKAGFRNIGHEQVSGILCCVFVKEAPEITGETL